MRAGGRVEAGRGVDKRGLDRFELSRGTYVETRPRNINSAPSSLLSLSKYLPAIFLIPLPLVKRSVSLITYLSKSNEPPPRSSRNSPIPGSRRFLKAFFSPFSLRLKSVEGWIRSLSPSLPARQVFETSVSSAFRYDYRGWIRAFVGSRSVD